jgi:pimeloyl-ACP methyl ester carboxylesterase
MGRIGQIMFTMLKLIPVYKPILDQLGAIDVQKTLSTPQNVAPKGLQKLDARETDRYTVEHVIEDGIERITYTPRTPKFTTPILMAHGMWHGAWCWQQWQEFFAEWGWTSVAYSLPGHGKSPLQRPIAECTLDYYLSFLRDEVARLPKPPILMGHSMGGALCQWYLRHVSTDLPAVVLVAAWVHDSAQADAAWLFTKQDPQGVLLAMQTGDATPYIRNPHHAAQKLISKHSIYTPEQLHAKLGPESAIITVQHNPPFWKPAENVKTPMLYLAGEKDAVVSMNGSRKTAAHYGAEFIVVPDAAHNLMMDAHYQKTAGQINAWLQKQNIQ